MRTYIGTRVHGREPMTVPMIYVNYISDELKVTNQPLKHICRHSPDGFEWGYGGSGPSDTALSIMVDHFTHQGVENPRKKADLVYQDFKWKFISVALESGFVVNEAQIEDWLEGQ